MYLLEYIRQHVQLNNSNMSCKLLKLFSVDYFDQHIILHEISLNIYFSIQNCSCLLSYFFTQIILVKILKLLCELCRAK